MYIAILLALALVAVIIQGLRELVWLNRSERILRWAYLSLGDWAVARIEELPSDLETMTPAEVSLERLREWEQIVDRHRRKMAKYGIRFDDGDKSEPFERDNLPRSPGDTGR